MHEEIDKVFLLGMHPITRQLGNNGGVVGAFTSGEKKGMPEHQPERPRKKDGQKKASKPKGKQSKVGKAKKNGSKVKRGIAVGKPKKDAGKRKEVRRPRIKSKEVKHTRSNSKEFKQERSKSTSVEGKPRRNVSATAVLRNSSIFLGRRDKLPRAITLAVSALFASSWCDESQPWLFGSWEETHLLQQQSSLRWHEVLVPLKEALRQVASEQRPTQRIGTGSVYSFGLASPGATPAMLHRAFPRSHIYGFDSFAGLPDEDHAPSRMSNWRRGSMKSSTTPDKVVASAGGKRWMTLTAGFYRKTLTTALATQLRLGRALFVDIDCELHSSTSVVLEWLFKNRIVRVGTLVGYDDWWTISCNNFRVSTGKRILSPLDVGEGLAHAEATKKHGLVWHCVAGPCRLPKTIRGCHVNNNWAPVFMLTTIGSSEPSTGFEFERFEMVKWMNSYPVCSSMRDM